MNLFQSELWGKFQASLPSRGKYWLIDGIVFIRHRLPLGLCWIECPRAKKIPSKIPLDEKAIFLRFIPGIEKSEKFEPPKKIKKTHSHFPQATIFIDLTKSEDEILAQMKQKGRYNIKVAQRHGVTIHQDNAQLDKFYKIQEETAKRDGFQINDKKYYEKMLEMLGPDHAKLWIARHEGEVIAGLIATYYGDTALYYYGASSNESRNTMAPYLLQWEVMRDARAHGFTTYDLFGIAPEGAENHPWSGVTEFKKKFGGQYVEYHDAVEKVLSPFWYFIYKVYKKLRG